MFKSTRRFKPLNYFEFKTEKVMSRELSHTDSMFNVYKNAMWYIFPIT